MVWSTSTKAGFADQDLERTMKKVVGKPYEEKPHVRFEVAGTGNGLMFNTAPDFDPTNGFCLASFLLTVVLLVEAKPLIIAVRGASSI
jgi:hypothetical protein